MPKQTTDKLLFPMQDRFLRQAIMDGLFFAPWTGDVETEKRNNADGTVTREIVSASNSIVERVSGFVGEGTDTALIPLLMELEENPLYGNAYFPGTGEDLRYQFRKVFINQLGKVVDKQKSKLDRIRTDKLEQSYKEAAPALMRFMRKWMNAEFISAIYDGHSANVTAGRNNSPDGIGATKVLHPNMFTNGVDPDTGGSLDVVGTAKQNKTAAEINASKVATGTVGTDIYKASPYFLDRVGETLSDLGVQKAATYNGKKYWLTVMPRKVFNDLKQNDIFRKDIREAFMGKEYNNPLFRQDVWVFDEFMLAIDNKVPRAWNADTSNFAGTNGYVGAPTIASGGVNHRFVNVLGTNALGWSDVVPFETRLNKDNFDLFVELLALTIFGIGRGEYVEKDNESTYFAKGNNAETTLSSNVDVFNQTSALFAVGVE